ncbi:MAG: glycosyltransferase family 4 protein [Verrucomicrobiota bacterium]
MKIIYATGARIPSTQANSVNVVNFSDALAAGGHEVELMCGSPFRSSAELEPQYGPKSPFRLHSGILGLKLKRPRKKTSAPSSGTGGAPAATVKSASATPSSSAAPKAKKEASGLSLRTLKRIAFGWNAAWRSKRQKVDLLYSRSEYACLFASLLGVKTAWEAHAVMEMDPFSHTRVMPVLARRGVPIFPITEALAEDLKQAYGFTDAGMTVLPDGANPPLTAERSTEVPSDGFNVGYVGHLYPGKGMEVISAVAPLCPWATFHIVGGSDDLRAEWREKCREMPNVIFHGYANQTKVSEYLNAFDAALLPILRKISVPGGFDIGRWTSPLKLFEYMAHRKAIVASDVPVLKEVLNDRKNSILCDPDNPQSWADALSELRSNEEFRRELAATAHAEFEERYTWRSRSQIMLSALFPDKT